ALQFSDLSAQHTISLYPPLRIKNCLTGQLDYRIIDKRDGSQVSGSINSGEEAVLHEVDIHSGFAPLMKILIAGKFISVSIDCIDYDWSNAAPIDASTDPQTLKLLDEQKRPLNLVMETRYELISNFSERSSHE